MKQYIIALVLIPLTATAQDYYNSDPAGILPRGQNRYINEQPYGYVQQPVIVAPQYRNNLQQQADLRLQQEITTGQRLKNQVLEQKLFRGFGAPDSRAGTQYGAFEIIE